MKRLLRLALVVVILLMTLAAFLVFLDQNRQSNIERFAQPDTGRTLQMGGPESIPGDALDLQIDTMRPEGPFFKIKGRLVNKTSQMVSRITIFIQLVDSTYAPRQTCQTYLEKLEPNQSKKVEFTCNYDPAVVHYNATFEYFVE